MIYGASGYTGRMAAERALATGLDIIVAGRDGQKLAALSAELGAEYRAFSLANHKDVIQALNDVAVVLNFAGPFAHTAEPLMRACMQTGAHYLDITAEINVYRLAERLAEQAAAAEVMLLPGVGWDVVPTDCLAMQLARRVKQPQSLRIALQVSGSMSRGSAISAGEIINAGLLSRVNGELVATPEAQPASFDFGAGAVDCYPLSFGDLITGWRSTAIANIAMFVHVTGDAFPEGDLSQLPDGPDAAERDAHRAFAVAEVSGADGGIVRAVIETVNGYTFTPLAAIEAARRVLAGESRPGFETPARLFGDGFAETIPGTRITPLP